MIYVHLIDSRLGKVEITNNAYHKNSLDYLVFRDNQKNVIDDYYHFDTGYIPTPSNKCIDFDEFHWRYNTSGGCGYDENENDEYEYISDYDDLEEDVVEEDEEDESEY
jgi:hypothetical protein